MCTFRCPASTLGNYSLAKLILLHLEPLGVSTAPKIPKSRELEAREADSLIRRRNFLTSDTMAASDHLEAMAIPSATTGPTRPRRSRPSRSGGTLFYFAYGSNLHVAQMAQRCPDSVFKGRAILPNYRWQINNRGVANVVESAGDSVEGLVYLVGPKDMKALDRSEGLSRGFYERCHLEITFMAHRWLADFKSSEVARSLASAQQPVPEHQQASSGSFLRQDAEPHESGPGPVPDAQQTLDSPAQQVPALVYLSSNYKTDGTIRDEYILRMRKAIADALELGVSKKFVNEGIVPSLEGVASQQEGHSEETQAHRAMESTRDGAAGNSGEHKIHPCSNTLLI